MKRKELVNECPAKRTDCEGQGCSRRADCQRRLTHQNVMADAHTVHLARTDRLLTPLVQLFRRSRPNEREER